MKEPVEPPCIECGGPMPPRRKTESKAVYALKKCCGKRCQEKHGGRQIYRENTARRRRAAARS